MTPGGRAPGHYLPVLLAIMAVGLALRLWLALTTTFLWDEEREWIPVALSISLGGGETHLPLRTDYHGALAAYFIRAGQVLLGDSHLAFRIGGILAGTATVAVVAAIARRVAGPRAALAAAAIIAIAEFPVMMSTVAIQTSYYLLAEALALLFFLRLAETRRAAWFYATAVAAAVGFLTYEVGALLLPVLVAVALLPENRWMWRSPHLYLAGLAGLALILPDLLASAAPAEGGDGYDKLLERFGSLGFKPVYLAFLFRATLELAYLRLSGRASPSEGSEYAAMNDLFGLLLVLGLLFGLWRLVRAGRGQERTALALLCGVFLFVLAFFLLIEPPASNPVAHWVWVGVVLLPGAVLAGRLAGLPGRAGLAGQGMLAVACLLALVTVPATRLGMDSRSVRLVPELLTALDGRMQEVTAHFDWCDLCAPAPAPVLAALSVETGGDLGPAPVADVEGADTSSADPAFALRSVPPEGKPGWMTRIYVAGYDFPDGAGGIRRVEGRAYVPKEPALTWPEVFWTNAP